MNPQVQVDFKNRLKQFAINMLEERIANNRTMMLAAQEAANEESKSSAGDKYETARAMNQLEKDMHAKQLAANLQEMAALTAIDCSKIILKAGPGSFIRSNNTHYFIAAGLGKISFETKEIYLLSPNAPLAGALQNAGPADEIQFNGRQFRLEEIF